MDKLARKSGEKALIEAWGLADTPHGSGEEHSWQRDSMYTGSDEGPGMVVVPTLSISSTSVLMAVSRSWAFSKDPVEQF